MKEASFRNLVGRFIIVSNIVLFLLIMVFYVLKGFSGNELEDILKALLPVQTVYMAAIIKYMVANKTVENKPEESKVLTKGYALTVRLIVNTHIILLLLIISLKAVGGIISNEMMTNLILIIETFFGAYIGTIITSLFPANKS